MPMTRQQFIAAVVLLAASLGIVSGAQAANPFSGWRRCCRATVPCKPSCPEPETKPESKPAPTTTPTPRSVAPPVEPIEIDLTTALDVPTAPSSIAPNMIGDQSGGGCGTLTFGGVVANLEHPTFACTRTNIAENNSPLPRDRVYFRYNHFENINETDIFGRANDISINRFTFGAEKTFFDGLCSIEVRIPFARELGSNITIMDIQGVSNVPLGSKDVDTEFGNISLVSKVLLHRSESLNISTGLAVNLPTASNVQVNVRVDDDAFPLAGLMFPVDINNAYVGVLENDTVNLSPFVATLWTPNSRCFVHGFAQIDLPLNPNILTLDGVIFTAGPPVVLPPVRRTLAEQVLLRLNAGAGYWIYRNPTAHWITGIAPTIEIHYTSPLDNAQIVSTPVPFSVAPPFIGNLTIGNLANRVDNWNLTLGNTFEINNRSTIATGFVIPVSSGTDKAFDFEFNLQLNVRFGPQNRATRVL